MKHSSIDDNQLASAKTPKHKPNILIKSQLANANHLVEKMVGAVFEQVLLDCQIESNHCGN